MRGLRRGQGHVKLTPEEVEQIVLAQGKVKQVKLAKRYGVHPSTISKIWNGASWGGIGTDKVSDNGEIQANSE